jgi:hypothetical protein
VESCGGLKISVLVVREFQMSLSERRVEEDEDVMADSALVVVSTVD